MERKPKYEFREYTDLMMPTDDMDDSPEYYHSVLCKTLKTTQCHYCGATIHKGDYALSERLFLDGTPYYIHDCLDCAEDVIAGWDDMAQGRWEKRAKESGYLK